VPHPSTQELRQEDPELVASLCFIVRPCLNTTPPRKRNITPRILNISYSKFFYFAVLKHPESLKNTNATKVSIIA
jgi:hypothetical protein